MKNQNPTATVRVVTLLKTPIELCGLLKLENLVQSGGEAKAMIAQGLVRVNGEIETRKRKKLIAGDVIEFAGEKIQIKEKQA
jgi:ribosome-associated protein